MNRYKHQGWYNESHRHSLARRGIKTRQVPLTKYGLGLKRYHPSFEVKKEKQIKLNYCKIDYSLKNKLREFISIKFTKAVPDHLEDNPKVKEAKKDIEKIDHPSKLKEWAIKHYSTLTYLGMGGAAAILGTVAGVPTLMQNTATGEIVAVGGTLLGRTGQIVGTVFTGMGVMEEAKVIRKEVFGEEPISVKELEVVQAKPKAFIIKISPKKKPIDTSHSEVDSNVNNTSTSLAEISSQQIPYHELTKQEKDTLFTAVNKVNKLLGKKGKKIRFTKDNLQVVERVGPDNSAYGAHQGNLIQIDRDTLKDQDKTEGVLLHESIHRVYDVRDETRDLENLQIDYLGLAM